MKKPQVVTAFVSDLEVPAASVPFPPGLAVAATPTESAVPAEAPVQVAWPRKMPSLRGTMKEVEIQQDELDRINQMTSTVLTALSKAPKSAAHAFGLESVVMSFGVNADGKIGFLGLGAHVGASATFELTFKRKQEA
jgi:hypothetical protein